MFVNQISIRYNKFRKKKTGLQSFGKIKLAQHIYQGDRKPWLKIRTNNAIEQVNREIRRRTRVAGCFPMAIRH
jgi:transposase-like protein